MLTCTHDGLAQFKLEGVALRRAWRELGLPSMRWGNSKIVHYWSRVSALRSLALAMVSHARLGAESAWGGLDSGLLGMVWAAFVAGEQAELLGEEWESDEEDTSSGERAAADSDTDASQEEGGDEEEEIEDPGVGGLVQLGEGVGVET